MDNPAIILWIPIILLSVASIIKMLNKGGIMFVATLNRTFESYIKAIVGAEYILRWLPIGTHAWDKFLKPKEIEAMNHQLGQGISNKSDVAAFHFALGKAYEDDQAYELSFSHY